MGRPLGSRIPIEQRFWPKVKKESEHSWNGTECWEWTGYVTQHGYGQITTGGDTGPLILVHRQSWILHFGDIPERMSVLHHCDNRKCVRPDHLFLGTYSDNMRDMIKKGRHPRYFMTMDKARAIRARYAEGNITYKQLAKELGIHPSTIGNILSGKQWKEGHYD